MAPTGSSQDWPAQKSDCARPSRCVPDPQGTPAVSRSGGQHRRSAWPEPKTRVRAVTGIADTGFLVAFAARRDRFFPWAHALAERIHEPLLTCEPVLAEAAFHLRSTPLVLRMLETGLVRLAFRIENHRPELAAL